MTILSDTQRVLLSAASQRPDASLLPLPASIKPGGGVTKALAALLRRGLAAEATTQDAAAVYRRDGDDRYGLYITDAGTAAIGVLTADGHDDSVSGQVTAPAPETPRRTAKATLVIELLTRADGATTAELIEATGWLPHTMRAALTGLRRKGHDVTRGKRDGLTFYRIAGQA